MSRGPFRTDSAPEPTRYEEQVSEWINDCPHFLTGDQEAELRDWADLALEDARAEA